MAPSLKTFNLVLILSVYFLFLALSEASTPPVDIEHNEMRLTNVDGDCNELQGKFKQIKQEWRRERETLEMLLIK